MYNPFPTQRMNIPNIFDTTYWNCSEQSPLLENSKSPHATASIGSFMSAMLSVADPCDILEMMYGVEDGKTLFEDLQRSLCKDDEPIDLMCLKTLDAIKALSNMGPHERLARPMAKEWWCIAVAICYQIFMIHEDLDLFALMEFESAKAAFKGFDMNIPRGEEEKKAWTINFRRVLRTMVLYPVQKYLINICYGKGAYYFATQHSTIAMLMRHDVIECVWKGEIPPRDYVVMAIQNTNSLPIHVFETHDQSALWLSACTYVCVMHILSMQDKVLTYFVSQRDPEGNWGQDALAHLLGIQEWIQKPSNQQWVWDKVSRYALIH